MDASTTHPATGRLDGATDDTPSCHVCGYSRRGIPAAGLCPECGEPPSPPVSIGEATSALALAKTQSDQAWLWCVGLGLVLLVASSVSALRVALVMRSGDASVGAVNVPAPKVWATALVHRSVGDRPGEWGIAGTLAVLGCLVAVWMVTEPQSLRAAEESAASVRRAARWAAVLLTGGGLGVLLGGYDVPYGSSARATRALLVAVALVELPANTLLYLHLRGLARRLRDRRAEAWLDWCAWLVPAAVAGGAALLVMNDVRDRGETVRAWRYATAAYGAAAVCCGVAATAAVARLAATALVAAAGGEAARGGRGVAALPGVMRRAVGRVARADVGRWMVVLGIAWWLWTLWPVARHALLKSSRDAVGGTVPYFNFPGPKVHVLPLVGSSYSNAPQYALDGLLLVWLLTAALRGAKGGGRDAVLRLAARWAAVVLVGLSIGWRLSDSQFERHGLRMQHLAVFVVGVEAPLTLLVYLHLAAVAAREGAKRLGRGLVALAFGVVAVMVTPPVVVYLLRGLRRRQFDSDPAQLLAGVYVAASLAVALLAASALVRLAVVLAAGAGGRPRLPRFEPGGAVTEPAAG